MLPKVCVAGRETVKLRHVCRGGQRCLFALDAPPPGVYAERPSGPLAQLVEQLTFNQWVAGSNPAGLTKFLINIRDLNLHTVFSLLAVLLCKHYVSNRPDLRLHSAVAGLGSRWR